MLLDVAGSVFRKIPLVNFGVSYEYIDPNHPSSEEAFLASQECFKTKLKKIIFNLHYILYLSSFFFFSGSTVLH
jgi:hypothetical protein